MRALALVIVALSLLLGGAAWTGSKIGYWTGERLFPVSLEAREWAKFGQLNHEAQDQKEAAQE
jgi:hypothetical protein